MHRFFTVPENITDTTAILRGTDVAHIRTVLRLQKGDRVQVLDGCGNCYTVILTHVEWDGIESRIECKKNVDDCESPLKVFLGQGMVKGTGFDGIVRRSVELGVAHILPVCANRCISRLSPEDTSKKIVLPLGTSAREAEKELILKTLQETGNNKAETSRRLGVDVKTIRNKLKSYGLM